MNTYLISNYDQVLEQLNMLARDIENTKMDAGVVVMMRNGTVDIRGLGEVRSTAAAAAVLFTAYKSMPAASQDDMLQAITQLADRSKLIDVEAPRWRGGTE